MLARALFIVRAHNHISDFSTFEYTLNETFQVVEWRNVLSISCFLTGALSFCSPTRANSCSIHADGMHTHDICDHTMCCFTEIAHLDSSQPLSLARISA
mmetsp:Transcript_10102/g.27680  ORF Transcript_10102/g.27680 Transcript_10102/m.27680 type:complete len:99 (-) Transcript_10102:725-1021(-)